MVFSDLRCMLRCEGGNAVTEHDNFDLLKLELLKEQDDDYHEAEPTEDAPSVEERWKNWSDTVDQ